MTFEQYLISKKIDSARFFQQEPEQWKAWKIEFEQMHPQSFTSQKLYLINPIRRKYKYIAPAKEEQTDDRLSGSSTKDNPEGTPQPAVKSARPVFKSKPKMN